MPSPRHSRGTNAPMVAPPVTTVDVAPHEECGDNTRIGAGHVVLTVVVAPVKLVVAAKMVIRRMLPTKTRWEVTPACSIAGWNGWDLMIATIKTKVIIPAPIDGVGESIKLVQQ